MYFLFNAVLVVLFFNLFKSFDFVLQQQFPKLLIASNFKYKLRVSFQPKLHIHYFLPFHMTMNTEKLNNFGSINFIWDRWSSINSCNYITR